MLVKIIKDIYGHKEGYRVIAKTPQDAPFQLTEERAERLIRLGVAVAVGVGEPPAPEMPETIAATDDYESMTRAELASLAKAREIQFTSRASKADLIKLLSGPATEDNEYEEADGEAPPSFGAALPED